MIRYALVCDAGHGFEAWFSTSESYAEQSSQGLVECPFCASREVRKQIMAPAVAGTKKSMPSRDAAPQMQTMVMEAMRHVRAHVEENFDYVGDAFAREARAIHEGEAEHRDIFGEATPAEVRALKEDGVPVAPLPPAPADKAKVN